MLDPDNTGLIVVDVQGKLARLVDNSDELIVRCAALIDGAKVLGLPVVWLEQNPDKLGQTVEELHQRLSGSPPITKFGFNACEEPLFIKQIELSQKTSWLICGIEAHICVYQTALGLMENKYDVHVVSDCVSSRSEENKRLAIHTLSARGISITGLEMCLYELVQDCRSPAFRPILSLIK
ncbi:hydrolase [Vibrio ulleungensis]|uniref:Hydrolase n=1 Tax=Vibrio ulleungensis TaxID=2807619 RepID=A0ABS2HBS6_9VIBR|nr:hydrolase [Vibrio ulleungensis]MBM7035053.1 hydrolase [Vibrio ulleungensis]